MITHLVVSLNSETEVEKVINLLAEQTNVSKIGVYEDMSESDFVFPSKTQHEVIGSMESVDGTIKVPVLQRL